MYLVNNSMPISVRVPNVVWDSFENLWYGILLKTCRWAFHMRQKMMTSETKKSWCIPDASWSKARHFKFSENTFTSLKIWEVIFTLYEESTPFWRYGYSLGMESLLFLQIWEPGFPCFLSLSCRRFLEHSYCHHPYLVTVKDMYL